MRLFGAYSGAIIRFDGHLMHLGAGVSPNAEAAERYRQLFPRPLDPEMMIGRAILDRTVVHIADVEQEELALTRQTGRDFGYRRVLIVPMLRGGEAIGTLNVTGREPGFYSDRQVALLKTFTDQAVIAIENVRLFTELQASNRELTTALDTQTATSDILRVISRSQADVQPVFDAIVQSAVRLLRAHSGMLTQVAGDRLELAAFTSIDGAYDAAMRAYWPRPLHSKGAHIQAIRDRAPINIADTQDDPRVPEAGRAVVRLSGLRSVASVPMLRQNEAIGTVAVNRQEPGGFTDDEIALLQTFADQAVIAIENARLLTELQTRTAELSRSVGELTALGEVGRALSSTLDVDLVLDTIVARANDLIGADGCTIFEYDERSEERRVGQE